MLNFIQSIYFRDFVYVFDDDLTKATSLNTREKIQNSDIF